MLSRMSNISIAKKITILFTSIFVLAVIMLTITVFVNANSFFSRTTESLAVDEINGVKVLILGGQEITESLLQSKQKSAYVDIIVTNTKTGVVTSNRQQINEWEDIGEEFYVKDDIVEYDGVIYRITVLTSRHIERKYIGSLATMLLIFNAGGLLLAVAASSFISSRILNPVEKIRQTAKKISAEDLSRRIDINGPDDEIKELATTFNEMFDRLELEFERQAQFVSDASHELRTPISVIQGYTNLIIRWGKDDPAVLSESIESIKAETEHMSVLIKKLLFLAKDKQNAKLINKEKMSLKDVMEEIAKEIEIMMTGHEVLLNIANNIEVIADYNLIKQLLWTLVDNSIKYTPKDGRITLAVHEDNSFVYASVEDTGIGIENDELPNIFSRFYRVDKSRNKSIGGEGLGLSIAEWIAKQHKSEIIAESQIGKGTKMTVKITK